MRGRKVWTPLAIITLLLCLALAGTACVSQGTYDELMERYEEQSGELEETKSQLDSAQDQLDQKEARQMELEAELGSLRSQLSQQGTQLEELEAELVDLRNQLRLYQELGITVSEGVQPFYLGIHLSNSPTAANPTWKQLKSFLLKDETDEKTYVPNTYMCSEFAEDVHDNAEATGIRAAWVAIDFEEGGAPHALNAFVTSDKGLIYVDCTGEGLLVPTLQESSLECDKIAYVAVGSECGLISLAPATPLDYAGYRQAQDTYDALLERYTALYDRCGGYATPGECWQLLAMYDEQEEMVASIGQFWKPMGTVSSIEVYW